MNVRVDPARHRGRAPHRIGRLELAISTAAPLSPARLASLRHMGRRDLPALIEDCAEAMPDDDPELRIDHLRLDLGEIDEDALPGSFLEPFKRAFMEAIAKARRQTETTRPKGKSHQVDRIETFLATGVYHATSADTTPEDALDGLLDRAPDGLAAMLASWVDDDLMRRRLGRQFSPHARARLLSAIGRAPEEEGLLPPQPEPISPNRIRFGDKDRLQLYRADAGPDRRDESVRPDRARAAPDITASRPTGAITDGTPARRPRRSADPFHMTSADLLAVSRAIIATVQSDHLRRAVAGTGGRVRQTQPSGPPIDTAGARPDATDTSIPRPSPPPTLESGTRAIISRSIPAAWRVGRPSMSRRAPQPDALTELLDALPRPILHDLLVKLAPRSSGLFDTLVIPDDKPPLAGIGAQTLIEIALANGRRRMPRRRIMAHLVASGVPPSTIAVISGAKGVGRIKSPQGPRGRETTLDDMLHFDAMAPVDRRHFIETRFGRRAWLVLAMLDASPGSLARPTAEAIFHAATERMRPLPMLARAVAMDASDRAGWPLASYIALVKRHAQSRVVGRILDRIASDERLRTRTAKGPSTEPPANDETSPPDAFGADHPRHGRAGETVAAVIDAALAARRGGAAMLRAYRPRSLLIRHLYHRPGSQRRAVIEFLAPRSSDAIWAWLTSAEHTPASRRWRTALHVLFDRKPRRAASVFSEIVLDAKRRDESIVVGGDRPIITDAQPGDGAFARPMGRTGGTDTIDAESVLMSLLDAMRRNPVGLVRALRNHHPSHRLVRALAMSMPKGALHDLVALLAGRDGAAVCAWLETRDRKVLPDPETRWIALTILLRRRWRRGSAMRRIVHESARRNGSKPKAAWSENSSKSRETEPLAVRSAHARDLLHVAPNETIPFETDDISSLWRQRPEQFLTALRDYTPRSRIVSHLVRSLSKTVLSEMIPRLAGDRARSLLRLVNRVEDDPNLANTVWSALFVVLLRCYDDIPSTRPRLAAIIAEVTRRTGLSIAQCRHRLIGRRSARIHSADDASARPGRTESSGRQGPAPALKKWSRSWSPNRIHFGGIGSNDRRAVDMTRPAAPNHGAGQSCDTREPSIARAGRLARRQDAIDRFVGLLTEEETSAPKFLDPLFAARGRASPLSTASARAIAHALRRSMRGLTCDHLARLASEDKARLIGALSRGIRPVVGALTSAAEAAFSVDGARLSIRSDLVALGVLLDAPSRTISSISFARAFVAALALGTRRSDRAIVAALRRHLEVASAAHRALSATVGRRAALSVAVGRPPAENTTARDGVTAPMLIGELDRLVAALADGARRSRRRQPLEEPSPIVPSAHGEADPLAALASMLWYGSMPRRTSDEALTFVSRLMREPAGQDEGFTLPGAAGLVARLRSAPSGLQSGDHCAAMTAATAAIVIALTASDEPSPAARAALRTQIAEAIIDAEQRSILADVLETGSVEVMRRFAGLLTGETRSRRSTRLMAREAVARQARDLFESILDHGALPWWGPVARTSPAVLMGLARTHPRVIASTLRARTDPAGAVATIHAAIGAVAARPVLRALARRDLPLIDAMIVAVRTIVTNPDLPSIAAFETLLAHEPRGQPSALLGLFADRIASRIGGSFERVLSHLSDDPVVAHATTADADGKPVIGTEALIQPMADRGVAKIDRLRDETDLHQLDVMVREALDVAPVSSLNLVRTAMMHPPTRGRIASLPRPTLVAVLAAILDTPIRRLRPLLDGLAVHPPSIDPILALIADGETDIATLVDHVRRTTPPRISTAVSSPTRHRPQPERGHPIHVDNAGLVILAPFLPRLFANLSLVAEDGTLLMPAAQRGAHVLQYLVNAETDAREHRLVLNKILCGLDIPVPLIASIAMDEHERATAESLLHAVTQNWPPLKTTSIEGLRDTFLRREGMLRDTAEAWVLTVTPGPFDMLLDRLPWPLSVVRLRWMTKLLKVEWR